jgi:hypothetical protein
MPRRSNKSIAQILSPTSVNDNDNHLALLERKITLATEGFTTRKFCELVLRDRISNVRRDSVGVLQF